MTSKNEKMSRQLTLQQLRINYAKKFKVTLFLLFLRYYFLLPLLLCPHQQTQTQTSRCHPRVLHHKLA